MKKMDTILEKADELLAKTCTNLADTYENDENDEEKNLIYEQAVKKLSTIDKDLKEVFNDVLNEKLLVYKDIKTL